MEFDVFVGGSGKKLTDVQRAALADFGVTLEEGAIDNKSYALVKKWLQGVIVMAKQNLAKSKAIASNDLAQSINIDPISLTDTSFVVAIVANDYWKFVDLGVKGAKSSGRAPNSPFSYRDKKPIWKHRPPVRKIQEWIAFKSIPVQGRDKIAGNRALAINISNKIWREGLRATNFMSNAVTEDMVAVLTENIAEVLGKTISVATSR
nr:hypothetical protein [Sphingomonadales bacterium]